MKAFVLFALLLAFSANAYELVSDLQLGDDAEDANIQAMMSSLMKELNATSSEIAQYQQCTAVEISTEMISTMMQTLQMACQQFYPSDMQTFMNMMAAEFMILTSMMATISIECLDSTSDFYAFAMQMNDTTEYQWKQWAEDAESSMGSVLSDEGSGLANDISSLDLQTTDTSGFGALGNQLGLLYTSVTVNVDISTSTSTTTSQSTTGNAGTSFGEKGFSYEFALALLLIILI